MLKQAGASMRAIQRLTGLSMGIIAQCKNTNNQTDDPLPFGRGPSVFLFVLFVRVKAGIPRPGVLEPGVAVGAV